MLQFLCRLFRLKSGTSGPSHHAEADRVYPVHFIDQGGLIRASIISYTFRFNDVLDASKLHSSLIKLLEIGDWKKLGGRLRRNENGVLVIHVPEHYDAEHPAVRYSHKVYDTRIDENPLASRLPKETSPYASVQDGCHTFRSFSVPKELPNNIEHYLTNDEPLICLYVTSFTDATLVSLTFPHSVCDATGTAELLKAWSTVLEGRIDRVPMLLGARRDVLSTVGVLSDEAAGKPFLLEHRQIKGFSLLSFILRFAWDLLTNRNIRTGTIFLPGSFIRELRQTAQAQLAVEEQLDAKPFLTDGDLITAWGSQIVMSATRRKRPAIICNVFDMRRRLDSVLVPGGIYVQNLILPASVLLSAGEMASSSLGQIALKLRQAIVEQATDTQARRLMRVIRSSIASSGLMPLFGDAAARVIACTNWSKARLQESANFFPAVAGDRRTGDSTTPPGSCVSYWGTTLGTSDNPRDTFIIYGRNQKDGYWLHAYLRPEAWDMIEAQFTRYRLADT
ncbi:hypothetical protein BJX61DRAFT_550644 [Aspergillus egyptiacus]|nr:hypothetical protein BJX61DRAFT_550644 [Aspergillus egyptiacus]